MRQRGLEPAPGTRPRQDLAESRFLPARATVPLVVLAVASLLMGMFLEVFGPNPLRERSADADSYSVSSIGHRALVETLRLHGVRVLVSRHSSAKKAGSDAVLIVAEPRLDAYRDPTVDRWSILSLADRVLIVCPKWRVVPDPTHPEWIARAQLAPPTYVSTVLQSLGIPGVEVIRPAPGRNLAWTTFAPHGSTHPDSSRARVWAIRDSLFGEADEESAGVVSGEYTLDDSFVIDEDATADSMNWLDRIVSGDSTSGIGLPMDPMSQPDDDSPFAPQSPIRDRYFRVEMQSQSTWLMQEPRLEARRVLPEIDNPQLLNSDCLAPVIASDDGMLVGETYLFDTHLVVLSDPDILANHGIARGDNALLASLVVGILHERGETVVMDESLHGSGAAPNVWRELLRFPLVLVPAHVGLVVLLLLLATVTRFGSPLASTGSLRPGKELLIANTAELMRFSGHSPLVLQRYFTRTKLEILRRLRGPDGLDARTLHDWLQRATDARGVPMELDSIHRRINELRIDSTGEEAGIIEVAQRIHHWRREMLHES